MEYLFRKFNNGVLIYTDGLLYGNCRQNTYTMEENTHINSQDKKKK